jgi:hypothetical protein
MNSAYLYISTGRPISVSGDRCSRRNHDDPYASP